MEYIFIGPMITQGVYVNGKLTCSTMVLSLNALGAQVRRLWLTAGFDFDTHILHTSHMK